MNPKAQALKIDTAARTAQLAADAAERMCGLHDETSARLDRIESKLDQVLSSLDALRPAHAHAPAPPVASAPRGAAGTPRKGD